MEQHRVRAVAPSDVLIGEVRYAPLKSMWFFCMAGAALIGGWLTFSWMAVVVLLLTTTTVLLFGHSLGSHRKLIHNSFQCPKLLEYVLVYLGVQVGLAGPLGLLRQHELRDYAQRLPNCHPYLRHGRSIWVDAWWQLFCDLHLANPPAIHIEARLAEDRFYRFLERTWMVQQLPIALLLFYLGGWPFVFFGSCARVTAGVFGHWLIGYFAHNHGQLDYVVQGAAVQGRNLRLTSLLTMGASWHKNPGWWGLLALQRCGLVRGITLPADLAPRPELLRVGDTTGNFSYESWVVGALGGRVEGARALRNSGLPTDRKGTTP